jgi:Septin
LPAGVSVLSLSHALTIPFFPDRCVYFLDPDAIIPPSAIRPPAPLLPRTHTNSVSQSDAEPVILEPPVTTNPLLRRPVLPQAEINIIRTLSSRVNVLPVIARADTLTNERMAAIKMAVRRDLAEAGIGFGIFDLDTHPPSNGDNKPFNGLTNGSSSSPSSSSPTSSVTSPFLRLPYALISPDCYSHSDGVNRPALPRHELVLQYTPGRPSSPNNHSTKLVRGKFTRSYRWGFLDVLDPNHSDFLPLRKAIFHHMQVSATLEWCHSLDVTLCH